MNDHQDYYALPRMIIIATFTIMAMVITRPIVAYLMLR